MGTCQSTETTYMFGFLNLQVTHMDLFSLLLGVGITIGTLYLIRCCKTHTKISKHILGSPTSKWGPYPAQIVPPNFHHNAPTAPQPPTTQASQLAVPWHIIWGQDPALYSNAIVNKNWTRTRWQIWTRCNMTKFIDKFGMRSIGHFIITYHLSNSYHVCFNRIYLLARSYIFLQIWYIYPFYVWYSHVALVSVRKLQCLCLPNKSFSKSQAAFHGAVGRSRPPRHLEKITH